MPLRARHAPGHRKDVLKRPLTWFAPFQPAYGAARARAIAELLRLRLFLPDAAQRQINRPFAGFVQAQLIQLPQDEQAKTSPRVQSPDSGGGIIPLRGP